MERNTERIVITELDSVRLEALRRRSATAPARGIGSPLDELLEEAVVVPAREVAEDVVTMHSRVLLRDPQTGATRTVTLCYPADSSPAAGFVSVLSPMGMGLLGRSLGSVARWRCPTGEERAAQIAALLFQPEAQGDYVT